MPERQRPFVPDVQSLSLRQATPASYAHPDETPPGARAGQVLPEGRCETGTSPSRVPPSHCGDVVVVLESWPASSSKEPMKPASNAGAASGCTPASGTGLAEVVVEASGMAGDEAERPPQAAASANEAAAMTYRAR
jgi:hypothetical protein